MKSQDMFGAPITLNFNGEDNFKTCFGGFASITVFIFLIVYSIALIDSMIKREETVINTNVLVDSLYENSQKHNLNQSNFIVALYSTNVPIFFNSSYLTISASQVTSTSDAITNRFRNETRRDLTIGFWGDSFKPILGDFLATNLNTPAILWIKDTDIFIGGNFASLEYNSIEWTISKWTGQSYWENETVIDEAIKSLPVRMAITDYYFDVNDYENPKKVNLVNDFSYFLASGVTKDLLVKIRRNKAIDYHDPFPLSSSKDYDFFSIGNIKNDFYDQGTDKNVMKITMNLDSKYTNIERRVYTLGDLFGQIGGMKEMLSLIAILFVSSYTSKLYISKLISSLYLVESNHKQTNKIEDDNKLELKDLHEESKFDDVHNKRMNTLNSISPKDRTMNSMIKNEQ